MSGTGTSIVDFGSVIAPDTSLAVVGQAGILTTSLVEAWISPIATADHTADEHLLEEMFVFAGKIIAGTGFTIFLTAPDANGSFGKWTVSWVWF